jgi:hypothetical protein
MENARLPRPNDILALTLAPREHAVYVQRVIRDPSLGKHYKVLFADILSLNANCMPVFDVVTLFHLCELDDASTNGQRLDAAGVLALLRAHVRPGGVMLFYPGSYGYPRLSHTLAQEVAAGHLSLIEGYRSLAVYRVAG